MSDGTKIEWTDATWNPITGCTKVSQGCKHCYAEREWPRMTKLVPAYAGRDFTDVRMHLERIEQPLHWKKPRRVFVNSMSDLFHESVHFEFIDEVFSVMARAPQHTFQVLTKRPQRMLDYLLGAAMLVRDNVKYDPAAETMRWPLTNVWLGVSVENQATADERVPLLLQTPAAVRWISAEPLLGPVSLDCWPIFGEDEKPLLHWIVVGGESGPKARPMHAQWARDLRDQCAAADVPFLFKQWGEWTPGENVAREAGVVQSATWFGEKWLYGTESLACEDGHIDDEPDLYRVGKKAAGRLLDGVRHDGYPAIKQ